MRKYAQYRIGITIGAAKKHPRDRIIFVSCEMLVDLTSQKIQNASSAKVSNINNM